MSITTTSTFRPRLPGFLKQKLPKGKVFGAVQENIRTHGLNTVCEEAKCPNRTHCYERGTLAFQILGDTCTRACGFCGEKFGTPLAPPDPTEAKRVVETARRLQLKHAVVTSPARDDLKDGGAGAFAEVVRAFRKELPRVTVEILVPDFQENPEALAAVFESRPDIFNHNIETVKRLTPGVRSKAGYDRSLRILTKARMKGLRVKSGLMVGLGESRWEIREALKDLSAHHCQMLTIGQYLPPSPRHRPLQKVYTPSEFDELRQEALEYGFLDVASGPLVRSSYHAEDSAIKVLVPSNP